MKVGSQDRGPLSPGTAGQDAGGLDRRLELLFAGVTKVRVAWAWA